MRVLRTAIVSLVVAGGLVLAVGAQSAEPTKSKKTISVTETELHAEGEKAELCFHLDASIEIADREEIAAALLLVEDAKRRKISPRDLSLTPTQICVQNLDHRRRYQATLKKLTGQKGERLAQAFTVSAVVPDRKPYLRFIGDFKADSLPRHTKEGTGGLAHQLDAVNIPAARLTLYHFPKPESSAGAWQQFQQIKISPAESLLFAKDRGQVVFESDLVFDAKPNKQQTLTAPLPEDAVLKKGLYYLAAMPQGKAGSNPALFTGQWFLVSDVRLLAARTTQGWHVSVFDGTAGTPLAGAEVTFWSRKGDALYVAKTDANGQANVSAKNVDETSLFLMTAQEAHGAIDLLAYTQDLAVSGALEPAHALIRPQRDAYMPGDVAEFFLSAESRSGAIQDVGPSVLRWVRSDGTTEHEVDTIPVPGGGARAAMPVPLGQEAVHWRAVWAKKDGTVLGQAFVPVMRDPRDLQITMSVGDDGGREELAGWASLQVRDQGGQPIPYKNGMLDVSPALPTDPAWPDYLFGIERPTSDETIQSFPFTTDAQGRAHIDLVPREPSQWGLWDAVRLSARLDGHVAKAELVKPVRQTSGKVGIRPLSDERFFPENSLARFDVIALDSAGRRRAGAELYYVVYEEGRSFEWYPADGQWAYKRLPEHRRVGGGALTLSANGPGRIVWPVTTGSYALEVLDASGKVLARRSFGAGQETLARIGQTREPMAWHEKSGEIVFTVPEARAAQVLMTDGVRSKSFVQIVRSGLNKIALPEVEAGWERRVWIRLDLVSLATGERERFEQKISLPLLKDAKPSSVPMPQILIEAQVPSWLYEGDSARASWRVFAKEGMAGTYTYTIHGPEGLRFAGKTSGKVTLKKDGRAVIDVGFEAAASTGGDVGLTLLGTDGSVWASSSLVLVRSAGRKTLALDSAVPWGDGQRLAAHFEKDPQGVYAIAPVELPEVGVYLATLARMHPQTTIELALWVQQAQAWLSVLNESGLLSAGAIKARREAYLGALLVRQREDGALSFGGATDAPDLASTAFALAALEGTSALTRAETWVLNTLKNTWFDEGEREDRAMAFAVMAQRGKADVSALRYFAEKGRDLPLSATAQAALATAFDFVRDEEAAVYWANRAREAAKTNPVPAQALRFLATSRAMTGAEAIAFWDGLDRKTLSKKPVDSLLVLDAVMQHALRAGSWSIESSDGERRKQFGVQAFKAKDGRLLINKAGRSLFAQPLTLSAEKASLKDKGDGVVERSLYLLGGQRLDDGGTLPREAWALLVIRGMCQKNCDKPRQFTLPATSAFDLQPIGGGSGAVAKALFPWLDGVIPQLEAVVETAGTVGFALPSGRGEWKAAFLVHAPRPGTFTIPPMIAQDQAGLATLIQSPLRVRVE